MKRKLTKKQLRAIHAKYNNYNHIDLSRHSNDELLQSLLVRAKSGDEHSDEYKSIESELRRRPKH